MSGSLFITRDRHPNGLLSEFVDVWSTMPKRYIVGLCGAGWFEQYPYPLRHHVKSISVEECSYLFSKFPENSAHVVCVYVDKTAPN